eukprot:scaffold5081_cov430-Prasinococcus_capsulatus_cf.AAC.8
MELHHKLRRNPNWSPHGCNICGQEGHQAASCPNGNVDWSSRGYDFTVYKAKKVEKPDLARTEKHARFAPHTAVPYTAGERLQGLVQPNSFSLFGCCEGTMQRRWRAGRNRQRLPRLQLRCAFLHLPSPALFNRLAFDGCWFGIF